MRVALGVEYNGTHFKGWQTQDGVRTVQDCVEQALSKVANQPVNVICAGRTDTGVHGSGQVVHMDVDVERSERSWVFGANTNLPDDISILWARPVREDFHARFSAVQRHYRYIILNRAVRPAIEAYRRTWFFRPLDADLMHEAGQALVGEHDFSSFRAQGCQAKSPVRHITRLKVMRQGNCVILEVSANAFLQHMIRNIAGVLMAIGCGKEPSSWVPELLAERNRSKGGVTAPPYGLYLYQVDYPEVYEIPHLENAFYPL